MILGTGLAYALLSYPLFLLMSAGTFAAALLGGLVFAVCKSLFSGCMAATLVELFPTRTRYTGMAKVHNIGMAVLGGTSPLAATGLIRLTEDVLAPAYYLIGAADVMGVACLFVKPRHGQPLDFSGSPGTQRPTVTRHSRCVCWSINGLGSPPLRQSRFSTRCCGSNTTKVVGARRKR
jgi:MHS family proline/betaine transporter-like MFS transporter